MMDLKNKKVTVMGLGLHGGALGNIEWLYSEGAVLTVTDMKTAKELAATVKKLKKFEGIKLVLGKHNDEDFTQADLIIRNPAVPRTSKYLQLAKEAGIPIEMDSSLFFEFCPSKNIIGVTGSKGKTTTSNAIAVLLKARHPQTVAVGVDGVSPLKELSVIEPQNPVVFELSSWRLEALDEKKISPSVAVVTSLYRDHLNTYKSFKEYIETKKVLVKYQTENDITLLNADDERLRAWEKDIVSRLFWYSAHDLKTGNGIFVRNTMITVRLQDGEHELFSIDELPFQSEHERRNVLPGILIALLHAVPIITIQKTLNALQRLPHRLEVVRELDSVTYINDSAATMPDATIAALKAFTGKSIVHILGGSDKALLFEELAAIEAQQTIRALVFLPGTATDKIKELVVDAFKDKPATYDAKTMPEAVELARLAAQPGDTILLSPGATSFGLFQHEFDRGDQFRKAVLAL